MYDILSRVLQYKYDSELINSSTWFLVILLSTAVQGDEFGGKEIRAQILYLYPSSSSVSFALTITASAIRPVEKVCTCRSGFVFFVQSPGSIVHSCKSKQQLPVSIDMTARMTDRCREVTLSCQHLSNMSEGIEGRIPIQHSEESVELSLLKHKELEDKGTISIGQSSLLVLY